ncbi:MAG TPA: VOC family protein [Acidimicrobiia bacterium]|jgi:methylmalonyl-CoA epimerase
MNLPTTLEGIIERFDHVAIAVTDVESALPMVQMLGGKFSAGADHVRNRFRWVQFELPGGSRLELIAPLSPDSFLIKFLQKRGEGIHHVTYKVGDVEEAARRLRQGGYRVEGLHIHPDWSEVFLHPSDGHGVLIQLASWSDDSFGRANTLEDVLAGRSIDET